MLFGSTVYARPTDCLRRLLSFFRMYGVPAFLSTTLEAREARLSHLAHLYQTRGGRLHREAICMYIIYKVAIGPALNTYSVGLTPT